MAAKATATIIAGKGSGSNVESGVGSVVGFAVGSVGVSAACGDGT